MDKNQLLDNIAQNKIKVSILEDELVARLGLAALLNSEPDIVVLGSYSDPEPFLESLPKATPDLVTIDLKLSGSYERGFQTIRHVATNYKNIKILVITSYPEINNLLRAIVEGMHGFTLKGKDVDEYPTVPEIIRMLNNGLFFIENSLFPQLKQYIIVENDSKATQNIQLTSREIDILELLIRNLTNKQIGNELNISSHTVKSHLTDIFKKLGVNDRKSAITVTKVNNLLLRNNDSLVDQLIL